MSNKIVAGPYQQTALPTETWRAIFLDSFSKTMNMGKSAKAAGVSRLTVLNHIKKDPEFALQVQQAKEEATDSLEEQVLIRARDGVESVYPIWYKGQRVGERIKKEFSDGLAEFWLKYHRPEVYNPAQQINLTANVTDYTDQQRMLITKAVQNGLDQGWSLDDTLQYLLLRGVPEDTLKLVKGEDLRLPDPSVINITPEPDNINNLLKE